jgi:ABC-type multidrug transport system fused ATPase/permease subunit
VDRFIRKANPAPAQLYPSKISKQSFVVKLYLCKFSQMQQYLIVYTGLSLLSIVLSVGSNALGQIAGAKARRVLHERALRSVMRSPMRFFECTPVGRLINRFATDMSVVDKVINGGQRKSFKNNFVYFFCRKYPFLFRGWCNFYCSVCQPFL